jgi:hypothetical protein
MLAALLTSAYLSQTPVPPKAKVEKKTVLIFTDEDPIAAGPQGPEGIKVTTRPTLRSGSLLKLRSDFNEKVIESAHEL